jgi:hypothetical protein
MMLPFSPAVPGAAVLACTLSKTGQVAVFADSSGSLWTVAALSACSNGVLVSPAGSPGMIHVWSSQAVPQYSLNGNPAPGPNDLQLFPGRLRVDDRSQQVCHHALPESAPLLPPDAKREIRLRHSR